jgi:hypothetical protein
MLPTAPSQPVIYVRFVRFLNVLQLRVSYLWLDSSCVLTLELWHDALCVACLLQPWISLILQSLKCTIPMHHIRDQCISHTCYWLPLTDVE